MDRTPRSMNRTGGSGLDDAFGRVHAGRRGWSCEIYRHASRSPKFRLAPSQSHDVCGPSRGQVIGDVPSPHRRGRDASRARERPGSVNMMVRRMRVRGTSHGVLPRHSGSVARFYDR